MSPDAPYLSVDILNIMITRTKILRAILIVSVCGLTFIIGFVIGTIHQLEIHNTPPVNMRDIDIMIALDHHKMDSFVNVISTYYQKTGKWPTRRSGDSDYTFGPGEQREIVSFLSETNARWGGLDELGAVVDLSNLSNGEIVDSYGVPFFIVFDIDGNGKCHTARWGDIDGIGPFIWTEGSGPLRSWGTNQSQLKRIVPIAK